MKYVIEFDLPDNDTVMNNIKTAWVGWTVWGYSGIAHAKPKQPEHKKGTDSGCTFLTCKHGGFGDDACSNCRWAYRDMYEADEEGAQE